MTVFDAVIWGDSNSTGFKQPDGSPYPGAHVAKGPSGWSIVRVDLATWQQNETPDAVPCIAIVP